jgi:hypothetical protein
VSSYAQFLNAKGQLEKAGGFEPVWMHPDLFDFQRSLVEWSVRMGRAAIFADCGMGKTLMELAWAENVRRKTNRPVLIVTPLAVSSQIVTEAERFGIEAERSRDGSVRSGITVTNYEQLDKFDPADFGGVSCDESSAIKSFGGERRKIVTAFMRKVQYRLLSTATAAPNDYIELGTSSEALGHLGHMDMLGRFFVNDQNSSNPRRQWVGEGKWRFKGHAEDHFWRWVCSWARAIRRPSDIGFDDARFVLPPLIENESLVEARTRAPGKLFELPAEGLFEERQEQRRTIVERCERVASLVEGSPSSVVWCHLNDEGKRLAKLIPGSIEVSGSDSVDSKEEKLLAFSSGQVRVLIIKPKIGAFGLNWQHCAHMTFFPSHSFEQYYQAVRRCWRFGQKNPVVVDIVTTEGGSGVQANLQRKSRAADEMFSALVAHMNNAMHIDRSSQFTAAPRLPEWLS